MGDQRIASAGGQPPAEVALRLDGVTKRFPGVVALRDVSFDVRRGEVHILFGENGAGKSTLVNLIAGTYEPSEGSIELDGAQLRLTTPNEARQHGINAVFQEFSLVPTLSVAANIFLGREQLRGRQLDNKGMERQAHDILQDLGFEVDPRARVDRLSRSEQQMVEIAKALQGEPKILILDEPTASLTEREADVLFALVDRLKGEGVGIVYITHRMQEIHRIGDRITVLRDGTYIATVQAADADEDSLVGLMTGREVTSLYPQIRTSPGEELLALDGVTLARSPIAGVSINVRAGEVVGVAGLVGSGKGDLAEACFGMRSLKAGELRVRGRAVSKASPKTMLDHGVYYLPADRRVEGLVLPRSLRENISLASLTEPIFQRRGVMSRTRENAVVRRVVDQLQIRPPTLDRPIRNYSGGNQQKAMFARGMLRDPAVVVLNEPTTGVDVGARGDVYALIQEMCERGAGVLVVSSDLPEILNLCHRAYVVHRGVVRAELAGDGLTEDAVLANFFDD
ncbi:sugar ABC transporter ATP-binding protein [Conexibacter arvalis]|uniref:Ribose transport system ATP-binding protein n=1 Tax=Conexibacter arvalis TaxID=912552 RepID=A0A840ICN3_9ACTN|nr:sugar ABC transporter ATP-binding protein [Conexibacter arvalis]MBB4662095.1 ribose transport system ATP-binding protein [Conexibacter arvalis]